MTITTDIVLRSPKLPLVDIPASLPTDEIEYVYRRRLESDRQLYIVQFDATDEIDEDRLTTVGEVTDATAIGRASGKDIYRLVVDLNADIRRMFDAHIDGAPLDNPVIRAEGWHETKVFKSYATMSEFQSNCEEHGVSLEVVSISSRSGDADEATAYGLTERQHEALTLAFSRGYYESPRQVSTAELADELGIAQPSMSSLLRRAESQLLSATLSPKQSVNIPRTKQ